MVRHALQKMLKSVTFLMIRADVPPDMGFIHLQCKKLI